MTVFLSKRNNQFKMSITTIAPSETVTFALLSSNDETVYWGDGNFQTISQDAEGNYNSPHTYAEVGTYNVVIDKPQRLLVFYISGVNGAYIGAGEIRKLKNLERLEISHPPTGEEWDITTEKGELNSLSELKILAIDSCPNVDLSDGCIQDLMNLQEFDVFNKTNIGVLPSEFANKPKLTTFNIYNCGLTEELQEGIIQVIYDNRMLYTGAGAYWDFTLDFQDIPWIPPPPPNNAYVSAHTIELFDILKNDPLEEGFIKWDGYLNEA